MPIDSSHSLLNCFLKIYSLVQNVICTCGCLYMCFLGHLIILQFTEEHVNSSLTWAFSRCKREGCSRYSSSWGFIRKSPPGIFNWDLGLELLLVGYWTNCLKSHCFYKGSWLLSAWFFKILHSQVWDARMPVSSFPHRSLTLSGALFTTFALGKMNVLALSNWITWTEYNTVKITTCLKHYV